MIKKKHSWWNWSNQGMKIRDYSKNELPQSITIVAIHFLNALFGDRDSV